MQFRFDFGDKISNKPKQKKLLNDPQETIMLKSKKNVNHALL